MYTPRIIYCSFIRVSTPNQKDDIAAQRSYHALRKNNPKLFCGSAWSSEPIIQWLKKKFTSKCKPGQCIQVDCFAFDRFSRNTKHCDDFRAWLKMKGYKFILTVDGRNYNYLNQCNYAIIRAHVARGQTESNIKSERAKRMWVERKKIKTLPLREKLNVAEEYFITQIVHTKNEDGTYIAANNLYNMLRSCGVKNINIVDIKKWRNELPVPHAEERVNWTVCEISDLCFATHSSIENINWQIFERFIPSITVAQNLAETYDFLNAVCKKETLPEFRGLNNLDAMEEAIENINDDEDTDNMSEDESEVLPPATSLAAPAADIIKYLQELISMKERGFITDEEFTSLKAKIC